MRRAHPQEKRRLARPHKTDAMMTGALCATEISPPQRSASHSQLMLRHRCMRFVFDPSISRPSFQFSHHAPKIDHRARAAIDIALGIGLRSADFRRLKLHKRSLPCALESLANLSLRPRALQQGDT